MGASLSPAEKQRVAARYLERLSRHGIDVATLKSGGAEKQFVRHTVHAGMFNLDESCILDVGCGIGMFYEYLRHTGIRVKSYIGIDIVEPFIESNRQQFPDARFEVVDIFQDPLDSFACDVVFMSQVFNNKYKDADNEEVAREAMRRLFDLAEVGLAIDFMTSYVDYNEDDLHYFSPEKMFTFAKTLTRTVALRHDYLPFEFTLFLYKQPTFNLAEIGESLGSNT